MHAQWRRQVAFLDVSGLSVTVFANKLVSGVMFANKDVRFGGGKESGLEPPQAKKKDH